MTLDTSPERVADVRDYLNQASSLWARDAADLLAALAAERDSLASALRLVSDDMHNTSRRPCSTCAATTRVLGEPFGCVAFVALNETGATDE